MGDRKVHLSKLKEAAKPLVELSSRDVAEQIETAVQQTIHQWNETATNLTQLCERYQRAVRLWSNYKTASEALIASIEEQVVNLDTMEPNETLKYIEQYTKNLPIYKNKLDEIQQMVDGIAAEIELDPTNLLTMEIDVMTKKLDHIQLGITKLADFADEKAKRLATLEEDIKASSSVLLDVEQVGLGHLTSQIFIIIIQ